MQKLLSVICPNPYLWPCNFDRKKVKTNHFNSSSTKLSKLKRCHLWWNNSTLRNFYTYKIDILIHLVLLCFAVQNQNRWCYRVLNYESMTELTFACKSSFSIQCGMRSLSFCFRNWYKCWYLTYLKTYINWIKVVTQESCNGKSVLSLGNLPLFWENKLKRRAEKQ